MKTRRSLLVVGLVAAVASTAFAAQFHHTEDHMPHAVESTVLVAGGTFSMGASDSYPDEVPVHDVTLRPFLLDRHEVTNSQFTAFVVGTGHVTQAERDGYAWCYIQNEDNFKAVTGADWRHPQGPGSSIDDLMDHPVVCVSWHDAAAYAAWVGKRLPTEAEWEYAARADNKGHFAAKVADSHSGHHQSQSHHLMDEATDESPSSKSHSASGSHASGKSPDGIQYIEANVWQGTWPERNELEDGFYYTAPAGSFEPNKWGVWDMIGNVWEWTADWYDEAYYAKSQAMNPTGPTSGEKRVARGGSWFCSPNYCGAYSTHYRGASPADHAFNNVGFRCAADISPEMGASYEGWK